MAELSMVDGWVRFRPLYRGRCLGNLIMCYVGHSSRNTYKAGAGSRSDVEGTSETSVGQMS